MSIEHQNYFIIDNEEYNKNLSYEARGWNLTIYWCRSPLTEISNSSSYFPHRSFYKDKPYLYVTVDNYLMANFKLFCLL